MRQDIIKLIESQNDVTNAIIFTHNVDFVFLQMIVLPALKHCGRPKLTIFADAQCAANTFAGQSPVLNTIGTRYRVVPVAMDPGFRFHPKALLLAGLDKATLLVGSGNMTFGGWRENAEIWVRFDTENDATAPFTAFRDYLLDVLHLVPLAGPIMDEINEAFDERSRQWAVKMDSPSGLLGRAGHGRASMTEQIVKIAGDGPVERLTVCSPYFDDTGRALSNLVDKLKPAKVDVLVQKKHPGLPISVVKGLPPHVEIIPIGFTRKDEKGVERESFIHAKFYGISNGERTLVVAGSANCSSAAMTIPGKAGNAELLAVQSLRSEQFYAMYLAEINRVEGTPAFPDITEKDDQENTVVSIRILAARYDGGILRVGYVCNKDTEISYCLVDGKQLPFTLEDKGIINVEVAQPPSRLVLEGVCHGKIICSLEGWVDVESELRSTAKGRSFVDAIRDGVHVDRWGIGAWKDILDVFCAHLQYIPSTTSGWGHGSTTHREKNLAIFTAQDVFSLGYGLPNLGSAVRAGLVDNGVHSLQQMLLRWFGKTGLDEHPADGEETPVEITDEGCEDVVDRPEILPRPPLKIKEQKPISELDRKKAQKAVDQVTKAMTSEDFLSRRSPEELAADLKIAAVLLCTGLKQNWIDETDFFEGTRLIWSSFFFSSPREPSRGWIERRCLEDKDHNEFLIRMASPELSAALATWCMTAPQDIKTPEHIVFLLAKTLAVARLPWLWHGGENEMISRETGLMLANTNGKLSDADLTRFEKDWITLMRRGAALRALEEVLGKNTPEELREKIREDQINRGELLWQGKSGYCVAMCSCKRSDKQNALVLRLQGTKKETFFKPSFLIPLRSLLCTDLIPESERFGTLQRNYIREMLSEISTVRKSGHP